MGGGGVCEVGSGVCGEGRGKVRNEGRCLKKSAGGLKAVTNAIAFLLHITNLGKNGDAHALGLVGDEDLGHVHVSLSLILRVGIGEVGKACAITCPLLSLDERPNAPKLPHHGVLGGRGHGIARPGVGVDVIHVSNVEVIGGASRVGVNKPKYVVKCVVVKGGGVRGGGGVERRQRKKSGPGGVSMHTRT